MSVKGKVKPIEVIVIPELSHTLTLGVHFWKTMGIVPDLRNSEWYFSVCPSKVVECVEQLKDTSVLTPTEELQLKEIVDKN